tara:strand:+ start:1361 stop:1576 length:216 start_codon:yes stop_codon:yes gene_type:complete
MYSIDKAIKQALKNKGIENNLSEKIMSAKTTKVVKKIYSSNNKEKIGKTKNVVSSSKKLNLKYNGKLNDET